MNEIFLLIPKAKIFAYVSVLLLADLTFDKTLGAGSILVAALVVIVAGVFTLRNNLKTFWKDLAEERGEEIKVLEARLEKSAKALVDAQTHHTAELVDLQHVHAEEMAGLVASERESRHELKGRLAIVEGQLQIEQSKHDLSVVIAELEHVGSRLDGIDELAAESAKRFVTLESQEALLRQIIETLDRKFTVTDITDTEGGAR